MLGFSEADLSGHLQNANVSKKTNSDDPTVDEKKLLTEDYQLYAALTILKGLSIAER